MAYTQWHHTANQGNPNVGFFVTSDSTPRMRLSMLGGNPDRALRWSGGWDLGALPRGGWFDHLVYIKWSTDPTRGRVCLDKRR